MSSTQHSHVRAAPPVITPTTEWATPKIGANYDKTLKSSPFNTTVNEFPQLKSSEGNGLSQQEISLKKGKFRPPIGIEVRKAHTIIRKRSNCNAKDLKNEQPYNTNQLKSITGKFARPLLPILGEKNQPNSWDDITKAPVAYQVQEILGEKTNGRTSSMTEILNQPTGHFGICGASQHSITSSSSIVSCKKGNDNSIENEEHHENFHSTGSFNRSISQFSSKSFSWNQSEVQPSNFHRDVSGDLGPLHNEECRETRTSESSDDHSRPLVYFPSLTPSSSEFSCSFENKPAPRTKAAAESLPRISTSAVIDQLVSLNKTRAKAQVKEKLTPMAKNAVVCETHDSNVDAKLFSCSNELATRKYSGIVYFSISKSDPKSNVLPREEE